MNVFDLRMELAGQAGERAGVRAGREISADSAALQSSIHADFLASPALVVATAST